MCPVVDDRPTFADYVGETADPMLLPDWYQPAPMRRRKLLTGWRRRAVLLIIITFFAIDAVGLCVTYGHIS